MKKTVTKIYINLNLVIIWTKKTFFNTKKGDKGYQPPNFFATSRAK